MASNPQEMARRALRREWEQLTALEKHVLDHLVSRKPITTDTIAAFGEVRSFGERMSDRIAAFGGSWRFVIGFLTVLVAWIVLNSWILARARGAFDPYPYILLNLFLSMIAAIQAPIIMMSQNRQAAKDRFETAHDLEVDLKAEIEIRSLHDKLDELREKHWSELVAMQQQQIAMLERLLELRMEQGPTLPPA